MHVLLKTWAYRHLICFLDVASMLRISFLDSVVSWWIKLPIVIYSYNILTFRRYILHPQNTYKFLKLSLQHFVLNICDGLSLTKKLDRYDC